MSKQQKNLLTDLIAAFDAFKYVGLITTAELNLIRSP